MRPKQPSNKQVAEQAGCRQRRNRISVDKRTTLARRAFAAAFGDSIDALAPRGSFWQVSPMNERISIHPRICHGQACIRGTRIPVHQIVRMFPHGESIETLLGAYPSITREDILACLDYAASLAEDQVSPLDEVVLTS